MKDPNDVILGIKMQIQQSIINGRCRINGIPMEVKKFNGFHPLGFKLTAAEVATIHESKTVNIEFTAQVLLSQDGNVKHQKYIDGNYGPIIISWNSINREYNIDSEKAMITNLIEN